ncbi:hypothetical protein [Paracidovorax sp. MALMAid1276]|uniref:hypothetical protein n=1 Tax=Paracidovorax sp. MALMAid1276 TaxID=3411631 RepID=UPI003B99D680
MAGPIDSPRSAQLPPVAQFLAEAALQRQAALLGQDKAALPQPARPGADAAGPPSPPSVSPPPGGLPLPTPAPADRASISAQAREQLGAGFDARRAGADSGAAGAARAGGGQRSQPQPLPALGAPSVAAAPVAGASAAAWPASGLGAPLMRLVSALVAQVTAQAGAAQRVVSAQPWPVGLAQALEAGTLDADQPPLQTWLVRQGTAQTAEGPRGFALTLRVPVPWLAAQAAAAPASAQAVPPGALAAASLQAPFAGGGPALQSGVMALVLQGMDAAAPRTSALLVLDMQPQVAATVYGRDMLQQATSGRLDPWTQMAVLQASGQVPRDEDRARNGASGLCETVGCPYAARAECAQPFCVALRGVLPPDPVGPAVRPTVGTAPGA